MTKMIALYLPQFHRIPENDKWWGEGFTDWVGVKNSVPLFKGHVQPKVPLNNNYYDLSCVDNLRWQAKLAKEKGIYGFGIYHYWFSSEQKLLTKPAELLLENKDIDMNYFFAWDNSTWIRSWSNLLRKEKYVNDWSPLKDDMSSKEGNGVLAELKYGDEKDWKIHFDYLLMFFKDERYIKIDNCPIFTIWNNKDKDILMKMMAYWNDLAKQNGFNGMKFISRFDPYNKTDFFDYYFNYEPTFSTNLNRNVLTKVVNRINRRLIRREKIRKIKYDFAWKKSIRFAMKNKNSKIFYGAFVNYDDTPRRGKRGMVLTDGNPEKFGIYISKLKNISESQHKEFIFITAWNEWGEGAYLEPDSDFGYSYLDKIKSII